MQPIGNMLKLDGIVPGYSDRRRRRVRISTQFPIKSSTAFLFFGVGSTRIFNPCPSGRIGLLPKRERETRENRIVTFYTQIECDFHECFVSFILNGHGENTKGDR